MRRKKCVGDIELLVSSCKQRANIESESVERLFPLLLELRLKESPEREPE
jgi:hypothetical protein